MHTEYKLSQSNKPTPGNKPDIEVTPLRGRPRRVSVSNNGSIEYSFWNNFIKALVNF